MKDREEIKVEINIIVPKCKTIRIIAWFHVMHSSLWLLLLSE